MATDFYCEEILNGKTPHTVVTETDHVLAFNHTRPSYESHVVVIPKQHVASLLELDDSDLAIEMLEVIQAVATTTLEEYGVCKVVTNLGEYQDSKHLHWHVVARPLTQS